MRKLNHHDIQWHAIDEIWINGHGRATVWSSDGQHIRQQSFQLGHSHGPLPVRDHIYRYDGGADPVLLSSVADAFQLADTVLSGWQWHEDSHLASQYSQTRPVREGVYHVMDADVMNANVVDAEAGGWINDPHQRRHGTALYETIKTWGKSISRRGRHVVNRLKAAGQAAWNELTR